MNYTVSYVREQICVTKKILFCPVFHTSCPISYQFLRKKDRDLIPCPFMVFVYKIMQIRPLQPSLMIRSMVSCIFSLASGGIR